jgi:ubiquinone/menaquinone biosynthesis C-methylase UbiE
MAGQRISEEQLLRTCHRYYWAREYVAGKDILEVACGAGQGLGYLAQYAATVRAGDIDSDLIAEAKRTWGERFEICEFDACSMPYAGAEFDVILIFEALYYLPDAGKFLDECARVLRPGGVVLIVNANKDLYDFTRSPYSTEYHGVMELTELAAAHGFQAQFWGYLDTATVSLRQKILRPVKWAASSLNLVPKSMGGKAWLKKLFFGEMTEMPASITSVNRNYEPPVRLLPTAADTRHKVIYCAASVNK